ncbi:MAG: PrsW family intramembrane metalloprotease [Ruminococcaceae bacterium]|nr:PrsW family intramembrane metalloprotease [Oscillospiraceae bacterium]
MMLGVVDKKARPPLAYLLVGLFLALFASELNGVLANNLAVSYHTITTAATPISEEVLKLIPVLFYATVFSDDRKTLLNISAAEGMGFAVLENTFILLQAPQSATILWALIRGFGTGLMHSLCALIVGIAISYVKKKRKLFYTGTFAALSTAIIYHAIFNSLVTSQYQYIGAVLPIVTYLVIVYFLKRQRKNKNL